jgi:tetratricopeptide (TPR) repeat protein
VRAQAYTEKGDVAKAIEEYTKILETYSDDPEIYWGRAQAYMYADKPQAAIADLKKAIELAPKDAGLWVGLGEAYLDYGENYQPDHEQADLAFTRALLLDPHNARAYYLRGNVRANYRNNPQGALDDVNKAIEIGPPTAEMYHLRAGLRLNLNNDNVGWQDDLDKAVAVNPKDPSPYHWRMEARFHLQQYTKAVEDADAILELDPKNWQILFERSRLHLILGDHTKAKADAQEIIYGKPEWAGGYAALAYIYMVNGDGARAVEEATKAVDRKEDDNAAWVLAIRARSYLRAGDKDSAAADLKTAAAIEDDNWMVLFGQAEVEFVNDRPDDALPYIAKWEAVNDGFGGAYVLRALIYANRNQYADARKDLERAQALALFPDEAADAQNLAEKLKP